LVEDSLCSCVKNKVDSFKSRKACSNSATPTKARRKKWTQG
jgi:hypothetical protein